jgi:hypothetical protein
MKKIISLFVRDFKGERLAREEVTPGAEWVIAGEGVATRKWDGTCCMILDGIFYKRYELKRGKKAPVNFVPATTVDEITGKQQGWVPVVPEDKWHLEAYQGNEPDGTYELVGPKVQNNVENFTKHCLIPHGTDLLDAPRTFEGLRDWFQTQNIEGIVWWHKDGRKVKIKCKDFGIERGF